MWVITLPQFLFYVFLLALVLFVIFVEMPSFILKVIREIKNSY